VWVCTYYVCVCVRVCARVHNLYIYVYVRRFLVRTGYIVRLIYIYMLICRTISGKHRLYYHLNFIYIYMLIYRTIS
jgi:CRISPR/Cas system-associated protein endoribonuclease Cas2